MIQAPRVDDFIRDIEELESAVARNEPAGDLADRIAIAFATLDVNAHLYGNDVRQRLVRLQDALGIGQQETQDDVIPVDVVRETFYNLMAEVALQMPDMPGQNLLEQIAARTLIEAVDQSKDLPGIPCSNRQLLTLNNCPDHFRDLLKVVLANKNAVTSLSEVQLTNLKDMLVSDGQKSDLAWQILAVAGVIAQREEFQNLGTRAINFAREARLGVPPGMETIDSIIVAPVALEDVTEELVRQSFFTIMAEHATTTGLITKEALQAQEPYIYYALSHHALIEAIYQSRAYKDVILLANDKAVNLNNCPAKYAEFAKVIFGLKASVCKLTPEQLKVVKANSVNDPDVKLPAELEALKTPEVLDIAARLERVAHYISELDTFKMIISGVIEFVADAKVGD